jgi:hypothetical protein
MNTMRKLVAGVLVAASAVLAVPAVASAGNAWGKDARECVSAGFDLNLGQAIKDGRAAHPGAKMTPKTIAQSVHCAQ